MSLKELEKEKRELDEFINWLYKFMMVQIIIMLTMVIITTIFELLST